MILPAISYFVPKIHEFIHEFVISSRRIPIFSFPRFKSQKKEKSPSPLSLNIIEEGSHVSTDDRNYVLAVCLADGNIVMLRSFDDVSPITVRTNLKAPLHAEWSNSRKLLAIAGTKDSDNGQGSPHEYANLLKFYSVTGTLVYTAAIPYTQVSNSTTSVSITSNMELFQFFLFKNYGFSSSSITAFHFSKIIRYNRG